MTNRTKLLPGTLFYIFLAAVGLLNLLQAFLTPLNPDEAYYWMYSRFPAWGYYDHPPAIAMMIKAGYALFESEFGLRLLTVISQLLAIYIVWQLVDRDKKKTNTNVLLFFLLLLSSPVLNIFGFFATPDSPLLLFEALFLLLYRRFRDKDDWFSALFLGASMAATMYSKYHGALLIVAIIISDLRLFRNYKFYIAVLFAIVLFLPHLYWQYLNDFPSFKYHLVERAMGLTFKEFPEYLLNTLLIHNPLILPTGIYIMIKSKNNDRFERSLKFVVTGILIFFLIMSFRDHVEPHWTALISIPLIIIIFNNIGSNPGISRYINIVTTVSSGIILFARIALMVDFLPVKYFKVQVHGSKMQYLEIQKIAGDRPVIFTNSYQNASKYTFYTGKFSYSLNNLNYRKNQFDIWDFEEKLHGKEVLYVPHFLEGGYREKLDKYLTSDGDTIFARKFLSFQSLQRECSLLNKESYAFSKGDNCHLDMVLFNPYSYPIDLKHEEFPVRFQACFFRNGILMYNEFLKFSKELVSIYPGESISITASFSVDDIPAGDYKLAICTETGIQYIIVNSRLKDATITE